MHALVHNLAAALLQLQACLLYLKWCTRVLCDITDATSAAAAAAVAVARAVFRLAAQGDFRSKRFSIYQRTRGSDVPIAQVERESRFASSTSFLM
jgi:ADP-ribosylglycohydrolase